MSTIYNLSWNETSFLAKLVLFLKSLCVNWVNIQSVDSEKQISGRLAFASTCYSILGSATAEFKNLFRFPIVLVIPLSLIWFALAWFPLMICCYLCLILSTNKLMSYECYRAMNAEQCDVLQSILLRRGYFEEANICIGHGLNKKPRRPHTHSLLYIGRATFIFKEAEERGWSLWSCLKEVNECISAALKDIEEIEKNDPQQAIRIYKGCAELTKDEDLRNKAKELAKKIDAKNQLAKI